MRGILGIGAILLGMAMAVASEVPTVDVQVEVVREIPATEAHILLLASNKKTSFTEAARATDSVRSEFEQVLKQKFPKASVQSEPLILQDEQRRAGSFFASSTKVRSANTENTQLLLITIPADPAQANAILDQGIQSGLIPFNAHSSALGHTGAIYYSAPLPAADRAELYREANQKMRQEAARLAAAFQKKPGKAQTIYRPSRQSRNLEMRFENLHFTLPRENCSAQPVIRYALELRAAFELEDTK